LAQAGSLTARTQAEKEKRRKIMALKLVKLAVLGGMAFTLYQFYPEMRRYLKLRAL
jgi:cell division septal protein FtsQ